MRSTAPACISSRRTRWRPGDRAGRACRSLPATTPTRLPRACLPRSIGCWWPASTLRAADASRLHGDRVRHATATRLSAPLRASTTTAPLPVGARGPPFSARAARLAQSVDPMRNPMPNLLRTSRRDSRMRCLRPRGTRGRSAPRADDRSTPLSRRSQRRCHSGDATLDSRPQQRRHLDLHAAKRTAPRAWRRCSALHMRRGIALPLARRQGPRRALRLLAGRRDQGTSSAM